MTRAELEQEVSNALGGEVYEAQEGTPQLHQHQAAGD